MPEENKRPRNIRKRAHTQEEQEEEESVDVGIIQCVVCKPLYDTGMSALCTH